MQNMKSILLHVDSSAKAGERIGVAKHLAEKFDASVIAQPCMLSAVMLYPYALGGATAVLKHAHESDDDCLRKARRLFDEFGQNSARMRWAEPLPEGPWGFARRALYADLLVMGQREEDDPAAGLLPSDFLPSVLVESGRPALILPRAGRVDSVGDSVVVAWKETPQASRALAASLPWLQHAKHVLVVSGSASEQTRNPFLAGYLQAHGIKANYRDIQGGDGEVGESILSSCADVGADLLVMGCYGHSRSREWIMGGATRSVLNAMTLPVLMAH